MEQKYKLTKKHIIIYTLLTILGGIALYYLIKFVSLSKIEQTLKRVFSQDLKLIIALTLIFFFATALRALRLLYLSKKVNAKIKYTSGLTVILAQTFTNNVVLSRLGEIVYIAGLRKLGLNYSTISILWGLIRIADVIGLLGFFIISVVISVLFGRPLLPDVQTFSWIVLTISIVAWILFILLLNKGRFLNILKRIKIVRDIIDELSEVGYKVLITLGLFSIVIWGLELTIVWQIATIVVKANITLWEIGIVQVLVTFASALPIHGIAQLGSMDLITSLGYGIFGLDKSTSTLLAISIHSFFLYLHILSGIFSLILMILIRHKEPQVAEPKATVPQ